MRNWTDRVPVAFTFAVALALAARAAAQEPPSGVEAGGHVAGLFSTVLSSTTGIAARIAVPVAPRIAIEGRVTLFPERRQPAFLAQGGRTIELQVGARGTFIARRRFSVYGVLLPGLVRFTDTITAIANQTHTMGSATHFALDMGTGVEFRPAARWSAYAEWAGPLYAVRGTELGHSEPSPSGATLILELPASIQSTAQFNAGLSYRFGSAHERAPEAPEHPRWTAGAQAGHTTYTADFGGLDLMRSTTIGAFGSAGILKWLDADAAFDALLRRELVHSPAGGGHVLQALAGVKAGTRSKRVGYFAKLRAGVRTRDSSVTSPYSPDHRPVIGRSTTGVLDYGAVIESYAGRRLVVRVDAGDVVSFYGHNTTDSLNVAVGIGWRLGG
jgi:hypothetical protein